MMNSVGKNISILYRQFNAFLNHELENSELNAQELMYLGFLYEKDGISQDTLASEFCIDKAAVARTMQAMEKKGIVKRIEDISDRRAKSVCLTDKAYEYKSQIEQIQEKWLAVCDIGLSAGAMQKFEDQINRMTERVIRSNSKE